MNHGDGHRESPAWLLPDPSLPARLRRAIRMDRLDIERIWMEFVSRGGGADLLEIEAYVHGLAGLCSYDAMVLECTRREVFSV